LKKILVLRYNDQSADARDIVYRQTLQYIAKHLPDVDEYQFIDNPSLLQYVKKWQFSTVIVTHTIPLDTAFLLKGAGLVQILIGMRDDLIQVSDIIVDPLMRKSEKYLVGTRYLLPSIVSEVSAADLATSFLHVISVFR